MNRQTLIGGIAVLVLVVAGVAYWVFDNTGGPPSAVAPPITGEERAEQARGIIADIEQTRARTAPETARPAATDQAAGGAGAVIPAPQAEEPGGASDLETAYEKALAFQRDGQLADAQLLFFFAARGGHGPSAFELGTMNDPNHHSPTTSLLPEPDPFQAFRWYSVAREQGVAGAAARLDALHAWANQAADAGDAEAERLLLQWER